MRKLAWLACSFALAGCASLDAPLQSPGWTGVWGAPPTPPPSNARTFENQTVRQVVRVSAGGDTVRVRFSNEYGDKPLRIGAAALSLAGSDGEPVGEPHDLSFGGAKAVIIPPKAPFLSDPVRLDVAALEQLSISIFLPEATGPCTCHPGARADGFISAPGDFVHSGFEPASTFTNRAFITGVEIETDRPQAIVAFGDSITDGTASTANANARWPDVLAERLSAAGRPLGVSNQAIAGNRVLSYQNQIFGESALTRFDRDVLAVPGARWLVVLEGINDIGMGGDARPSADQMIAGYRQIISRARANGIKVYAGTLLPYEGARYYSESGEIVRQAVNEWIRGGGAFDGIVDFDAAMRDPDNPKRMKPDLQSGDWLHPNDAGYRVMGEAVDLDLFR